MRRFPSPESGPRGAFTLIELLIVIAIVAIIAVVVILVLNPGQLLAQSRDTNRVSDLSTLQSALNAYITDSSAGGQFFNLGNASSVYLSLPDASSTCGSYSNLPTLPTGYTYHCASPDTYRQVNGAGWLPVNFASTSFGSPLGNLPVDPTNSPNSCTYYAYVTNGRSFAIAGGVESQKEKAALAQASGTFLDMLDVGTNPLLIPTDFASACGSSTSTPGGGGQTLNQTSSLSNSTTSFTFSGYAGESINIAVLNMTRTGNCPNYNLTSPTGTVIANWNGNCNGNWAWNNIILPASGTYTFTMTPTSGTTTANTYLSTSLPLGTVALNSSTILANQVYGQYMTSTFAGTAGQATNFSFTGMSRTDNCPSYTITSPTGTTILNWNGNCNGNWAWNNFVLPGTGMYTLIINPGDSRITTTITMSASLATTTIPFNTATLLANHYAGQYINGAFTGTASETMNLAITGMSRTDNCPSYTITSPSGTTVLNWNGNCNGNWAWNNFTLPSSGTYAFTINPGDSSVTTTVMLSDNAATTTVPFDTPTKFATQYTGQYMIGTFTGTAGQSANFAFTGMSRTDNCPSYNLYNPSGTNIANWNGNCNGNWAWNNIILPSTGAYVLTINPGDSSVTTTLTMSTSLATTTIPFNTATILANQFAGQYITGAFAGTASETMNFAINGMSRTDNCPSYTITSPSGTAILNSNGNCSWGWAWNNITLPSSGTYTVTINPGDSSVTTTVMLTDNATIAIPFNTATTFATLHNGQYMIGTFAGSASEAVNFAFTGMSRTDNCPSYNLYNPSGTNIGSSNGNCSWGWGWNNVVLPSTGTYTLTVNPGDSSVTTTLMLSDDASLSIPFNTPTTFATQYTGQYMIGTFTGSANESLNLAFTGMSRTDNCPSYVLTNPSGSTVGYWNGNCSGAWSWNNVILPSAGTYTLTVNPGDSSVTTTLMMSDSANLGTIPANTNTVIANSYAGQYAYMTFSATANQVVNLSVSGITRNNSACPTYYLLNPSGGTVKSTNTCGGSFSFGSTTLSAAGTYTVSVNPGYDLVTSTMYLGE